MRINMSLPVFKGVPMQDTVLTLGSRIDWTERLSASRRAFLKKAGGGPSLIHISPTVSKIPADPRNGRSPSLTAGMHAPVVESPEAPTFVQHVLTGILAAGELEGNTSSVTVPGGSVLLAEYIHVAVNGLGAAAYFASVALGPTVLPLGRMTQLATGVGRHVLPGKTVLFALGAGDSVNVQVNRSSKSGDVDIQVALTGQLLPA